MLMFPLPRPLIVFITRKHSMSRLAIHESFESTHWWLRRCMLTCS
ncbi:hypothetical protein HanPSC8_Chr15g0673151 [Helianthus annuus]|nr:hypothetical protein HanPSC8_Chr15g0673151 [Helianthus annuus]